MSDAGEVGKKQDSDASKKQDLLMNKLRSKGKIMVQGTMLAVIGGEVCNVRAYDPKEGAYIVQLPSRQLTTVKPTQVVRLQNELPEEEDHTVVSKYSNLKTW
jgi:hypothetical protein